MSIPRKKFVAGNFKMNTTSSEVAAYLEAFRMETDKINDVDIVLIPPFTSLSKASEILGGAQKIRLGAQNMSPEPKGAYTGEISAAMLKDVGATHVLVGHSERRAMYGETDAVVAEKFIAAQAGGLIPVLCVGETLEEREAGITEAVVARQLEAVVTAAGIAAFAQAVVAYEPVWAIGTGRTASPEQAQAVHGFIRGYFAAKDVTLVDHLRVLYGGSVKASNAAELFGMADVDGGLVGGASLKADEFVRICVAAR